MRIQKKVLISAFIGILLFCSAGLSLAKEPIKIGIPLALTGDFAPIGVDSRAGVQFAVDKINGAGGLLGRPVEIVLFDIKDLAPERLMAAADKLIGQDKVDTVHAGWAGWGQDIKAFGGRDVPYFVHNESISCREVFRSDPKKYYNVWQLGDIERNHAADSFNAMDALPYKYPNKNLAIVATDDSWGSEVAIGVKEAAEKKGWKVVMDQRVPYGTREWGPILTQIRSLNPAMIHFEEVSPPDAITFFRQFMKAPTKSLLNFGFSIIPPGFMETMGKEADGLLGFEMTAIYLPAGPTPESNAWLKEFTEKMKRPPGHPSSASYTGIMIWAEAAKAVGDPKKYREINEYIAKNRFKTILGYQIKFNEDHIIPNTEWPLSIQQVQNAVRTTIYTKPGVKYLDYKFQIPPWIQK